MYHGICYLDIGGELFRASRHTVTLRRLDPGVHGESEAPYGTPAKPKIQTRTGRAADTKHKYRESAIAMRVGLRGLPPPR